MRTQRSNGVVLALVLAPVALGTLILTGAEPSPSNQGRAPVPSLGATTPREDAGTPVEWLGRVVCLAEAMHDRYGTELPSPHSHLYGFQTEDGTFYTLLETKFSEALFKDRRLLEKRLLLKGRILPKSHVFEVMRTRSVREGKVYDLHYYCSVCHIESVAPGACACCQGEVELVETLLSPRKQPKLSGSMSGPLSKE